MDSDDILAMYPESESDRDVNEIENHEPVRPNHGPAKRKCPPRDQPFMDNWLTIPEINGWLQPGSQGLHFRYPCYGEDPDTGWSHGTQILGA